MVTGDQREVVDFLSQPQTHGLAGGHVARVETHSAMVFLAGNRALKLKRAVRYDYLDFSTPEQRRRCCLAEVALNQHLAPSLYRGVAVVTREPSGRLALDGHGEPVEWLVDMTRFDGEQLADRLAARDALPLTLMPALAQAIADVHDAAQRYPASADGATGMAWVVEGNRAAFLALGDTLAPERARARLIDATARTLDAATPLLAARRAAGLVRQCHGDLHLGNIVVLEGRPTLFDAVEFNDAISRIDVLYDLAFVLMDLWHRALPRHANALLNEYLQHTGDLEGLALLPLFLSCRAVVRAKTSATAATLADADARPALMAAARDYLALAEHCLAPGGAMLVAVGGLSGTGKSTAAALVAPAVGAAPGAVHLRTDVLRKVMHGLPPLAHLPEAAYAPEVTAQVYARLRHDAATVLAAGHAVICDGVFGRRDERDALASVAANAGVPFVPVWLDAPETALVARVATRTGDASDATADVVRRQLASVSPPPDWTRVDAGGGAELTAAGLSAAVTARASRR